MIDKPHQLTLLLDAARDYQRGLMSLQMLIHEVEGLLAVIEDGSLSSELSDALFALEYVNAHAGMADYDFETEGRSTVENAVREIIAKTETYSPH